MIGSRWFEVGLELLMKAEDEGSLKVIRDQFKSDFVKGATSMLELWLERQPNASWNQLIKVLKMHHIGLETTAIEIENMLIPTRGM